MTIGGKKILLNQDDPRHRIEVRSVVLYLRASQCKH
jgi:hypothetical protein